MSKFLKVLFVKEITTNKSSASFNRNNDIEKMVAFNFQKYLISNYENSICFQKNSKILKSVIGKILFYLSLIKLFKFSLSKKRTVIFLRTISPLTAVIVWVSTFFNRACIAIERNEYPDTIVKGNSKIKIFLYEKLILTWHYKIIDVFFLMTDALVEYYSPHTRKKCLIVKLPMTVDFERFEKIEPYFLDEPYIFYAGSLSEEKDGVDGLIDSFGILHKEYQHYKLLIAGGTKTGKREEEIRLKIKKNGLENKIFLLGKIPNNEIPSYLLGSSILVLPRPDSLQAKGGFPTKLGEYLASGKPVVVTRVGEIPKYLTDDEVYFIDPNNLKDDLLVKLRYVIENYDEAIIKGAKGREAAKRHFSLESVGKIIKETFSSL